MPRSRYPRTDFARYFRVLLVLVWAALAGVARGEERRILHGHLPDQAALVQPLGRLPATNVIRLALLLPLRNMPALTNLLERLYDPNSPDYHHYLTAAQFDEQFAPTAQEYQQVVQFAKSNGLAVTPRGSRMLLDARGSAAEVEKAFRVRLLTYQHPTEPRRFIAPDVAPTVDSGLPITDVIGLGDYAMPRTALRAKRLEAQGKSVPASGVRCGWLVYRA